MVFTFSPDHVPLWAVFPLSLLLVLLSIAAGSWAGARFRRRAEHPEGPIGSVVAALLGLLAFMLAFTFGMAASRFDARKELLLEDVNAIATAARCAELLPEPRRSESLALLDRYVAVRVEVARDASRVVSAMAEAESLQNRLWTGAVALARADMNSDIGALYAQALDDLATVHTRRTTVALQYRIPQGVWTVLLLLTGLCMGAVGFQFGIAGRSSLVLHVVIGVAFSSVVMLIAQLDRPTEGALRISQQPMLELERRLDRRMHEPPAPP
jgi:hypothetical protein